MPIYRKKPSVVEAWQYVPGDSTPGVCRCTAAGLGPHVHTIHAGQPVALEPGDYVVVEPDGEHYYPVKAAIFHTTYDRVEREEHAAGRAERCAGF